MALPEPSFVAAHGVLQLPSYGRSPERDDQFIRAVQDEFPNVVSHQFLPAEVPLVTPHLTLTSSSSQLVVSAVQADFEVRFYGEFVTDMNLGLDYVERKLLAILAGFKAAGSVPMTVGLIATLHFSFRGIEGDGPAAHIIRNVLNKDYSSDDVQDALARVALKVRDTYFVTLTASNYESRVLERALVPGTLMRVRPWDGRIEDTGVELAIDINNNLEARVLKKDPVVTEDGIRATAAVLRRAASSVGRNFAETGAVTASDLDVRENIS